jgi:hypothetical protein
MADDIVAQLRGYDFMRDGDIPDVIMNEAADEIEQLRQKEFMWKMSCVRIATKFMPLSLLLSKEEKEELQIIIREAVNG